MTFKIVVLAVVLSGSGSIPERLGMIPGQLAAQASISYVHATLSRMSAGNYGRQSSLAFTKAPSMIPVSQHDDDLSRTRGGIGQLQLEGYTLGRTHDGGVSGIEAGSVFLTDGVNDDISGGGVAEVLHLEMDPSTKSARDQGDPPHVYDSRLLVGLERGSQLGVRMADEVAQPDHERRQNGGDGAGSYRRINAEGSSNVTDKGGESLHLLFPVLFGMVIGGGMMVAVLSQSRSLQVKALLTAAVAAILLCMVVTSGR